MDPGKVAAGHRHRVEQSRHPAATALTAHLGRAAMQLLLMICNTEGLPWRCPRKPPNLSHWQRNVFPEMGRYDGAESVVGTSS
jgi:hypothetical protein